MKMKKILIRTKEKTFYIGAEDVVYCKAAGAYSVIYLLNNQEIITSINLLNLFEKLKCFPSMLRISQSHLINIRFVRCIHHTTKEIELSNNFFLSFTIKIKELEQALINIF